MRQQKDSSTKIATCYRNKFKLIVKDGMDGASHQLKMKGAVSISMELFGYVLLESYYINTLVRHVLKARMGNTLLNTCSGIELSNKKYKILLYDQGTDASIYKNSHQNSPNSQKPLSLILAHERY